MLDASERRLAENELVYKRLNQQVKKNFDEVNALAEKHGQPEFMISKQIEEQPLHFYCECSEIHCAQRIVLSQHDYSEAHKLRKHFIVVPGHENPLIERVIRTEQHYKVVEKLKEPPKAIDNLL